MSLNSLTNLNYVWNKSLWKNEQKSPKNVICQWKDGVFLTVKCLHVHWFSIDRLYLYNYVLTIIPTNLSDAFRKDKIIKILLCGSIWRYSGIRYLFETDYNTHQQIFIKLYTSNSWHILPTEYTEHKVIDSLLL